MNIEIDYSPCAQPTIARPMAEAVSLVQGGKPVKYFDTSYQQEREVNAYDLRMLNFENVKIDDKKVYMHGDALAMLARRADNILVNVNVNDIIIEISKDTTVDEAMTQYVRQYRLFHSKSSQKA